MFVEIAEEYTKTLMDYTPFHKASDREAFDNLLEPVKKDGIKAAESYLGFSFKEIPATVFMEYVRTGNRSNFESMNFSKRYALNALVMGECIEHKGRFMDDIVNGIYSICQEYAWQLPAHNSYVRDTPAFILPDLTNPVVDLFAAETGALLATISYILYDEIEAVSPFINKMIKKVLEERIYTPYLNSHFWWMGNGDEPMCNWTVWCTQNVLLTVFLNKETDYEFRNKVIKKAAYGIDAFLKDYGEDGCCDEGAHYYRHSALCLFNCINILNAVTDNHFSSVYAKEKIKNICTYIFRVNISGKYYFNYADCSAVLDRAGAGEFLFAKAIGHEEMMRFAALDMKAKKDEKNEGELNLYLLLQELFTLEEALSFDTSTPVKHSDFYYESVGLFIAHDNHLSLSVKAGDNNDSHNHNDTGSIIVYKDGEPLLIDVGVETYTKKTFSSERYDIWTMQSAYHNLPTINGVMQHAGEKFAAKDVDYFLSSNVSDIKMDIADAYPQDAKVESYLRHVSFYKNKQIVIEDNVKFKKGDISDNRYFLSLMSYEKPIISGNEILIGKGKLQVIGDSFLSYETIPIEDQRLKWSWKHDIYRIIITPNTDKIMIVIQ